MLGRNTFSRLQSPFPSPTPIPSALPEFLKPPFCSFLHIRHRHHNSLHKGKKSHFFDEDPDVTLMVDTLVQGVVGGNGGRTKEETLVNRFHTGDAPSSSQHEPAHDVQTDISWGRVDSDGSHPSNREEELTRHCETEERFSLNTLSSDGTRVWDHPA
ncbi:hypothetical protein MJT46_000046 [Ovis ammon polii x Ovis aries]|nr:hypothetical protein MJT46_000046 [Ovis ammon polii x Ovis aries]